MKKTLWLLSGIPASGKSTWARRFLNSAESEMAIWHSRDMIRFNMLKEGEDYFAHEDEVYELFVKGIQASLNHPFRKDIIVDQTNLNDKARNKLLSHVEIESDVEIVNVVFDVPLHVCLERNAQRTGREKVPNSVIRRMFYSFQYPENGYRTIIINEKGEESKTQTYY